MPRQVAMLVWAVAAILLPPLATYASDLIHPSQPEAVTSQQQHAGLGLARNFSLSAVSPERRSLRLSFRLDATALTAEPDDFRYGLASRGAIEPALKWSADTSASRAGWHFSGRLGPMRWLTPLDGEGEAKIRFGGRLPGQPRMPGMGRFNVGIHYNF